MLHGECDAVASHGSANGQAAAQPLNEENSAAGAKSNFFQEMSNFAQHQRGLTDTNLLTHRTSENSACKEMAKKWLLTLRSRANLVDGASI